MSFLNTKKGVLFFLILLVPFVYAGWQDDGTCEQDTECTILRQLVNYSTREPIPDALCNITIYDPGYNYLGNYSMANSSTGFYNHTINYNSLGKYQADVFCIDNTSEYYFDNSFIISETYGNYYNLLYVLIILLGMGLLYAGIQLGSPIFTYFSGFIFITFAIAIYVSGFPGFYFRENLIRQAFAISMLAFGLYIIINTMIRQYEGMF